MKNGTYITSIQLTQKEIHKAWNALAFAERHGFLGPGTDKDVHAVRMKLVDAMDRLHSRETGCDACDMSELLTTPWEMAKKAHDHNPNNM